MRDATVWRTKFDVLRVQLLEAWRSGSLDDVVAIDKELRETLAAMPAELKAVDTGARESNVRSRLKQTKRGQSQLRRAAVATRLAGSLVQIGHTVTSETNCLLDRFTAF
jgi:hypothetical protein